MGLLDQILGGALGGRSGGGLGGGLGDLGGLGGLGGSLGGAAPTQNGGMSRILIALLPVVLSMLANRRSAGSTNAGGKFGGDSDRDSDNGGGGGSGGLGGGLGGLGSILGGAGLGGLLDQFRQRGLSNQADSWVGTSANQSLAPEDVQGVFGADDISRIAQEAGLNDIETREGLAQLLPDVVDRLTPNGQVPSDDDLNGSLDDFLGRLRG